MRFHAHLTHNKSAHPSQGTQQPFWHLIVVYERRQRKQKLIYLHGGILFIKWSQINRHRQIPHPAVTLSTTIYNLKNERKGSAYFDMRVQAISELILSIIQEDRNSVTAFHPIRPLKHNEEEINTGRVLCYKYESLLLTN